MIHMSEFVVKCTRFDMIALKDLKVAQTRHHLPIFDDCIRYSLPLNRDFRCSRSHFNLVQRPCKGDVGMLGFPFCLASLAGRSHERK